MELVYGPHNATKSAVEEDVITSMPENVITNILDRLPIKEAVRTGILSRNWRFNWNMVTQLEFDADFFKRGSEGKRDESERNISRILLQLKGSITKYKLIIPVYKTLDVEEFSLWVMFLSRKGVKDFTLLNNHKTPITLPSHLFSGLDLKRLGLHNCCFQPPPNFHGFPNLLVLNMTAVRFESYKCGELITHCPILKVLTIDNCILSSKVKLAEIAKLKNLLSLSLSLRTLDITPATTSGIFQFLNFFPKLKVLSLDFEKCKLLAEPGDRKGVHTSFPCLKTLHLWSVDFEDDEMVSYVFEMICCSPNLQTLDILGLSNNAVPPSAICSSDSDYKKMGKLQLRNVFFMRVRGSENEVYLIKSLLASSPLLKTMQIRLNLSSMVGGADGKFMFAKKLLNLYRASPVAKIDLK